MKHGIALSFIGLLLIACSSTPDTTDGGPEAGATDAKPDKAATDSGGDSNNGLCKSGLTCEVCDGNFTPAQMNAPYANAALCASADITAYVAACGSAGTETTCNNWQDSENTSAPKCLACVYSDQSASTWGPLVCDSTGACTFNLGGCLDVASNSVATEKQAGGSGSCGDLYNSAVFCEGYSCNTCVSDSDYNTCLQSADANECKQYADLASSTTGVCAAANSNDASAAISSCFNNTDSNLQAVTTMFCGGATADGG